MSSAPRLAPSSLNCTPTTPTSSEASAVTGTVPATVAPLAGDVTATAGGVVLKVTVLSVLVDAVLRLPAPSLTTPAETVAMTVPLVMPLTATL